jgi:hypothetical protein
LDGQRNDSAPRLRLIHWNEAEAAERAARLRTLGYEVDHGVLDGPAGLKRLRENPPAAVVIDLSRIPSQGRDVGIALRSYKDTRPVPLVFIGGEPEKVERIKTLLPDASYAIWDTIARSLKTALAHPPLNPLVPPSRLEAYSGTPLLKKLGIKPNTAVALVGAPAGFVKTLSELPRGSVIKRTPGGTADLVLWFIKSKRDLAARMETMAQTAGKGGLWIIWPKKKSAGISSDLNQMIVRRSGLAAGLVDYKVCSVDETWSGLLFARRKITSR